MNLILVEIAAVASPLNGTLAQWTGASCEPLADDPTGSSLLERVCRAIARGHDRILVDLSALTTLATDEVKVVTEFLWTIRVEGGEPVVFSPHRDATYALCHLKLDRAFPVFSEFAAAVKGAGEQAM